MNSRFLPTVICLVLVIVGLYLVSARGNHPSQPSITFTPHTSTTPAPSNPAVLGAQTKTTGCMPVQSLPDPACTPGAVLAVTATQVCQAGYASAVRNVSASTKTQVYAAYGIATHEPGQYEVDHLISLELGGSNDPANLWPEPAEPRPGFHEKDRVEDYLHDQVCSGSMSLQEAQRRIATNWLSVYHHLNP